MRSFARSFLDWEHHHTYAAELVVRLDILVVNFNLQVFGQLLCQFLRRTTSASNIRLKIPNQYLPPGMPTQIYKKLVWVSSEI